MSLPIFQTSDRILSQLQTQWAQILSPTLDNPLNKGIILNSVKLSSGSTTINHRLSRKLQGWLIIGIDGAADVFDAQANNQMSDKTLVLVSSAAVTVTLYVF